MSMPAACVSSGLNEITKAKKKVASKPHNSLSSHFATWIDLAADKKCFYKLASSTINIILPRSKKGFINCFLAVNQDYHMRRINAWRDLIFHTAHSIIHPDQTNSKITRGARGGGMIDAFNFGNKLLSGVLFMLAQIVKPKFIFYVHHSVLYSPVSTALKCVEVHFRV